MEPLPTMRKLILQDSSPTKEYPIGACLTLGSKPSNTIQIKNSKVDAEHARVIRSGEHVYVEDLDSRYGLTVNGKKVRRWALKPQDVIAIAGMKMLYVEDDQPEPPPAQPAALAVPQTLTTASTPLLKPEGQSIASSGKRSKVAPAENVTGPASSPSVTAAANPRSPAESKSPVAQKPATQRFQVVSAAKKPGMSSGRLHADSSRFAEIADAALKAKERADTGRHTTQERSRKPSSVPLILASSGLLVLMALLIAYAVTHATGLPSDLTPQEREAIERLRLKQPKDDRDLASVKDRLYRARKWREIEAILGEPDIALRDSFPLYEPERGTYDFAGHDFRAYYLKDEIGSASNPNCDVAAVLLFDICSDGRIICHNARSFARKVLPPESKGEELRPTAATSPLKAVSDSTEQPAIQQPVPDATPPDGTAPKEVRKQDQPAESPDSSPPPPEAPR